MDTNFSWCHMMTLQMDSFQFTVQDLIYEVRHIL